MLDTVEVYLGSKGQREAIAMMLRQHIDTGFALPSARATLRKIQLSKSSSVLLREDEISDIFEVLESFLEDHYWTPQTEFAGLTHYPRWIGNPKATGYLSPDREKILLKDLLPERWSRLEKLGVPENKIYELLKEAELE